MKIIKQKSKNNVYLDRRLYDKKIYKNFKKDLLGLPDFLDTKRNKIDTSEDYYIYLYESSDNIKHKSSIETGFFSECMHIDKRNLYANSIINTDKAQSIINNFSYEKDVYDLIQEKKVGVSKYKQPNNNIDWGGVVYASQNPRDKSVRAVTSSKKWWENLEEVCKYYGKNLLIKLHPWNAKRANAEIKIKELCSKYGCTCGYFNHSCLDKCEFVILGCSSFSVDCMLRGVPVKQMFRGYFHNCKAITFCDGNPRIPIRNDCDVVTEGKRLANFLANKYCFRMDISSDSLYEIITSFNINRHNDNPFPLPNKHSYFKYLENL